MTRFLLALAITFCAFVPIRGEDSVVVNPKVSHGIWEGWGISLCWWANVFGDRDDLADLAFTTNYVDINGQTLPGLGLNIVRYNAGACTPVSNGNFFAKLSPKIPAFKQMEGFWLSGTNEDCSSSDWNWAADPKQRAMLLKSRKRGANQFELFSNSPLWWMCENQNPSGATGGTNNLVFSNHNAHAYYLASIAKEARQRWGVNFTSVEPFNEPVANWWASNGHQEGCHFDVLAQAAVIGHLRTNLDQLGLHTMVIAASDESLYDQALSTWNGFDVATRSRIGRVNVHGYQHDGGRRDLLVRAIEGKRLWNSEYGDADASGLTMAKGIHQDFRWLHPTAWCYWQMLDIAGWGLIESYLGENRISRANPKYFVLAQYTRHIRPGVVIFETDGNTVAAYDRRAKKLILVSYCKDSGRNITFDLSHFARAEGPVQHWMTQSGSEVYYKRLEDLQISEKRFSAEILTNSVQTFEVQNVSPDL